MKTSTNPSASPNTAGTLPGEGDGTSGGGGLAGELDAADDAVEHALSINPSYLPARVTRVYNRLARGDVATAKMELAEIAELGGSDLGGVSRARRCALLPSTQASVCATTQ